MSGQAGWRLEGERYSIFVGSGVNVAIALTPGDDGSGIGAYFDRESEPYRRWLERARPALDALFEAVLVEGVLPLVPLAQPHEEVDGAVIDRDPEEKLSHFKKHHRGGPCLVNVSGARMLPSVQTLQIRLLVTPRVYRRDLDALARRVADVLLQTL
jgi:hypothetical protein